MFKRIRVTVDGSETSDLALEAAIRLAQTSNGRLRLVHALDEPLWMAAYGMHGRTAAGLHEVMCISADQIIRTAPVPVLVIRGSDALAKAPTEPVQLAPDTRLTNINAPGHMPWQQWDDHLRGPTMNAPMNSLYQQIFTRLQQREAELRALLAADDARALQSATGNSEVTDFKEIAAQGASAAVENIQVAHAAAELSSVVAAQRRLEDGTYGFCADCGEPIAEQRLLALPQSPYCMACQAQHESSVERHGSVFRN